MKNHLPPQSIPGPRPLGIDDPVILAAWQVALDTTTLHNGALYAYFKETGFNFRQMAFEESPDSLKFKNAMMNFVVWFNKTLWGVEGGEPGELYQMYLDEYHSVLTSQLRQ